MDPDPTAVEFDLFSADTMSDPAFYHGLLRQSCPVHRFDGFSHPLYSLTLYDDVFAQLRDPDTWSSRWGQTPMFTEEPGLRTDPPEHTTFRRLINPIFNARRVATLEDRTNQLVHSLIDDMVERGSADLYRDLAAVLPVYVIADLLGIEPHRHDDFRQWTAEFVAGSNAGDAELEGAAREKVYAYFSSLLDARRRLLADDGEAGTDDVINILVTAEHPERRPFTDEEILPLTMLLLAGGTDTTSFTLTNCTYRLLEHRTLWEQVAKDPSLVDVAIEESLRFDPPVMGTFRTNVSPVTIRGVEIPAGSKVQGLLASANRDPSVWDDPDAFRLDRDVEELRRKHLAFGFGTHFCVGAPLARLEARVALKALVERLPSMWLRRRPAHVMPYMIRGINELQVSWAERT